MWLLTAAMVAAKRNRKPWLSETDKRFQEEYSWIEALVVKQQSRTLKWMVHSPSTKYMDTEAGISCDPIVVTLTSRLDNNKDNMLPLIVGGCKRKCY